MTRTHAWHNGGYISVNAPYRSIMSNDMGVSTHFPSVDTILFYLGYYNKIEAHNQGNLRGNCDHVRPQSACVYVQSDKESFYEETNLMDSA